MNPQPGILAPCAPAAHYLSVRARDPAERSALYAALRGLVVDEGLVVGIGKTMLQSGTETGISLRDFPDFSHGEIVVPATQADVWFYLRGADPGGCLLAARELLAALPASVEITEDVAAFHFAGGRDLSGYEDGTENPEGDAALAAAFVASGPFAGGSFLAAQRWIHNLSALSGHSRIERDHLIGRDQETNEELEDAPESAHVKRAAQESFEPEAFMLRRSMPYGGIKEHGLYFVAFGADLDRFERVMHRMVGRDDGIVDGLFRFSRPVSGGYYWCPPVENGRLVLP